MPQLLLKVLPFERSRPPPMTLPVPVRNSKLTDWSSPQRKTLAAPALRLPQQLPPHLINHQHSPMCFSRPTPPSRTTPQKPGPRPPSNSGCVLLNPKYRRQPRKSCAYSRLQTSKVSTDQLDEAATRYGLPLTRVTKLSIQSLQHIVSVGAAIAC